MEVDKMLDSRPIITIIIPVFNREHLIKRAVNSVINQSFENWECLVIDDGSVDKTCDVVNEMSFADSRIRLIKRDKSRKKGGATCRNIGIENAVGKYIAFLDSDDEWVEDKLRAQVVLFEKKNQEHFFLYSEIKIQRQFKIEILPKEDKGINESISEYLFFKNGLMQTSSFFMKTTFAKKVLFDEGLSRHQDYQFVIDAEKQGATFILMKEVLVNVYWNEGYNTSKRGWSPEVSIDFANRYLGESKVKMRFLTKNVLNACLLNGKYESALNIFRSYPLNSYHLKDILSMMKLFIIGLIKKII